MGFLLVSCQKVDQQAKLPNSLFKENILSSIPQGVRIIEARRIKATPRDTTVWITFDSSQKFWNDYARSAELREVFYELSYASSPVEAPVDTGFEGYLDGEYKTFERKAYPGSVFFVRKLPDGVFRVVFFKRGA